MNFKYFYIFVLGEGGEQKRKVTFPVVGGGEKGKVYGLLIISS